MRLRLHGYLHNSAAMVHRMIGRLALQQSAEDLVLAPSILDISCVGRGTAPKLECAARCA